MAAAHLATLPRTTEPQKSHTPAELAEMLGTTENWVKRHAAQLPHHRFGRSYVFTDDHVAEIFEAAKRRPTAWVEAVHTADADLVLRPSGYARRMRRGVPFWE